MGALLHQYTVVQHPNGIGTLHGGQAVGNHQGGAPTGSGFQGGLYHALAMGI